MEAVAEASEEATVEDAVVASEEVAAEVVAEASEEATVEDAVEVVVEASVVATVDVVLLVEEAAVDASKRNLVSKQIHRYSQSKRVQSQWKA